MKRTMVFIKLVVNINIMLILSGIMVGMFILAYNEGFTTGEGNGSLSSAQYVAQRCHQGGKLIIFGETYYCGRIQSL